MSVRPLVIVPNDMLRQQSSTVIFDKKTLSMVDDLTDTLMAQTKPKGVGLSAPQIGKNWNIFVTWLAANPEDEPTTKDLRTFINPVITQTSKDTTFGDDPEDPILEGCLSIPNTYGPVPRYSWIEMQYEEKEHGEIVKKEERFEGFLARVLQHEYDHLHGILFIDYSQKFDLPVYQYVGKKMKEIDKSLLRLF